MFPPLFQPAVAVLPRVTPNISESTVENRARGFFTGCVITGNHFGGISGEAKCCRSFYPGRHSGRKVILAS
jgi:hypothetical protein